MNRIIKPEIGNRGHINLLKAQNARGENRLIDCEESRCGGIVVETEHCGCEYCEGHDADMELSFKCHSCNRERTMYGSDEQDISDYIFEYDQDEKIDHLKCVECGKQHIAIIDDHDEDYATFNIYPLVYDETTLNDNSSQLSLDF